MDAGLAALIGAAIGALGSNVAMFLQTRTATRTERMRQIVQLAIEDHKSALEQGRHEALKGGKLHVAPLVVYLQYHEAVLRAVERGELDNPTLQRIRDRSKEIHELTQAP